MHYLKRALFFAVLFVLVIPTFAHAQIFIEKGKITRNIKAGETIIDSIIAHNTSSQPVNVKIYWEDFLYIPPFDGSKKFLPAGTTDYSCARWVNFTPSEYRFPPYGKKEIEFTVSVPQDVQGGYYGVLFLEILGENALGEKGVSIVSRIGCLFFLEAQDKHKTASIRSIALKESRVTSVFMNQGDVILIPEGVYYIMDEEGLVIDRGEIPKVYLPPGETAEYAFDIDKTIAPGNYTLVLTVDLGEGAVLVKEVDFNRNSSFEYQITDVRD